MAEFDNAYWAEHYGTETPADSHLVNPYLVKLAPTLGRGTALDAGCGTGTEARWLASNSWDVTAVDISWTALAAARAGDPGAEPGSVRWMRADLSVWQPIESFDLVFSAYAHAAIPQLDLFRRFAGWVRPGGTLLIVAHQHDEHGHHPEGATARLDQLASLLDAEVWDEVTVREADRDLSMPSGSVQLHDLTLTARRKA